MWPETLPAAYTTSAVLFIAVLATLRITLVRRASLADHIINVFWGILAIGVALREPVIARQVAPLVPGGLPTLFDVWHWTTVLTWAWGLGLMLLHKYGPGRFVARFRAAVGVAVLIGVAFLVLSTPARAQGISVAEYGGWRWGVYIGLLSAPAILVSAYMLPTLGMMRQRATTPRDRMVVRVLYVIASLSAVPVAFCALFATLDANGIATGFAGPMYKTTSDGLASGEPQLIFATILSLVVVPSCLRAVTRLRQLARLEPLWRELTAAVPGVVLTLRWSDRWGASPAERLERLHIEIRDAAEIVARFTLPLPVTVDELIDSTVAEDDQEQLRLVAELVLAARLLTERGGGSRFTDQPTAAVADLPDEDTLLRLWLPAKSLLRESDRVTATATSG